MKGLVGPADASVAGCCSHNLSFMLASCGRHVEALREADGAIRARKKVVAEDETNGMRRRELGGSLRAKAEIFVALGRRDSAAKIYGHAAEEMRTASLQEPTSEVRLALADTLSDSAVNLALLGRRADALGALEESGAIYSPLAAAFPGHLIRHMSVLALVIGVPEQSRPGPELRHSWRCGHETIAEIRDTWGVLASGTSPGRRVLTSVGLRWKFA